MFIPFLMMLFVAIYFGISGSDGRFKSFMHKACVQGITKSPYQHVKVSDLRQACINDYMFSLVHETYWAALRSALQVIIDLTTLTEVDPVVRSRSLDVSPSHVFGSPQETSTERATSRSLYCPSASSSGAGGRRW
jgi:hypothetical protein